MNVRRFTARTSRDALVLVRQALGEDAVVLSTKPCTEGVEVLAMAPETMRQVEKLAAKTSSAPPPAAAVGSGKSLAARAAARIEPTLAVKPVEDDVAELSMSTLSFQDYVRERMLRRRQASLAADTRRDAAAGDSSTGAKALASDRASVLEQRMNHPERPTSPVIGARRFGIRPPGPRPRPRPRRAKPGSATAGRRKPRRRRRASRHPTASRPPTGSRHPTASRRLRRVTLASGGRHRSCAMPSPCAAPLATWRCRGCTTSRATSTPPVGNRTSRTPATPAAAASCRAPPSTAAPGPSRAMARRLPASPGIR